MSISPLPDFHYPDTQNDYDTLSNAQSRDYLPETGDASKHCINAHIKWIFLGMMLAIGCVGITGLTTHSLAHLHVFSKPVLLGMATAAPTALFLISGIAIATIQKKRHDKALALTLAQFTDTPLTELSQQDILKYTKLLLNRQPNDSLCCYLYVKNENKDNPLWTAIAHKDDKIIYTPWRSEQDIITLTEPLDSAGWKFIIW